MADDSKRSKLSLPGKPASAPSTERRTRAPLRGSSKPRAPAPGRHRSFDESAGSAERRPGADRPQRDARGPDTRGPRREGERPTFGDRPPRRDGERPAFGDRPPRPAGDRSARPANGPRREEDRSGFGDRLPREEFRGGAGRGHEERRPYNEQPRPSHERPAARREADRPAYGERPSRPTFRDAETRRPEGRNPEERRPYADRAQREGDRPRYEGERPAARRESDRPVFRDGQARRPDSDRPRPAFNPNREEPRTYAERPRRDIERDGPAPAPTFGDDQMPAAPRGNSFGRSRAEPREASQNEARPQAAPERHRKAAPPESFANSRSPDTHVDQPGAVRLSKLMSELGLCSRREADDYIERGWVKVDGVVVAELGTKVLPHQHIEMLPVAEEIQLRRITILINKPIGYVSGQAEDGYEPAAVLITPENHWSEDPTRRRFESRVIRKLAPAGRLDIDSTGLLVLTQDGLVAKQLIGETSEVEKEYLVRVEGDLSQEGMRLLHHGLELDGVELQPAKVSWQNEDQLRFVLQEGRKRQIRRMCEMVGLKVVGLKRVRIGKIPLGKLPLGQWRYLGEFEGF